MQRNPRMSWSGMCSATHGSNEVGRSCSLISSLRFPGFQCGAQVMQGLYKGCSEELCKLDVLLSGRPRRRLIHPRSEIQIFSTLDGLCGQVCTAAPFCWSQPVSCS